MVTQTLELPLLERKAGCLKVCLKARAAAAQQNFSSACTRRTRARSCRWERMET